MTLEATLAPAVDGTETFVGALALAGANQGSAVLKYIPPLMPGRASVGYKASNTAFTLAEISGGTGVFATTLPGNTVWRLPTMYQLGWTNNVNVSLEMRMQRQGLGQLFVNPAVCRGTGNQAAMLAVVGASLGDTFIRTDTTPSNQIFILGGTGDASILANWGTGILPTDPRAPNSAGVVIVADNGFLPQFLPQWHGPITYRSVGLDQWIII